MASSQEPGSSFAEGFREEKGEEKEFLKKRNASLGRLKKIIKKNSGKVG